MCCPMQVGVSFAGLPLRTQEELEAMKSMPELGHVSAEDFESYCVGWLEQGHRPEVSDWARVRCIDIATFAESMASEARCFSPTLPPDALAEAASKEWGEKMFGEVDHIYVWAPYAPDVTEYVERWKEHRSLLLQAAALAQAALAEVESDPFAHLEGEPKRRETAEEWREMGYSLAVADACALAGLSLTTHPVREDSGRDQGQTPVSMLLARAMGADAFSISLNLNDWKTDWTQRWQKPGFDHDAMLAGR